MVLISRGDELLLAPVGALNPVFSVPWLGSLRPAKHWNNARNARFAKKWELKLPTSAISEASPGRFPIP